jgi:hypothetical protein
LNKHYYILILASFLNFFCDGKKDEPLYLAKVSGDYLSLEDLKGRFDTNSIKTKSKVQDYINQWVNQNLLFKEAIERGVTKSQEFNDLVKESSKAIAINILLENELYSKPVEITQIEVQDYYNNHRDEFILGNEIVNISCVVFSGIEAAREFKAAVKTNNWISAVTLFKKNAFSNTIISIDDSAFFKSSELSPPDVWKAAINSHVGDISEPIRALDGFIVLKLNSYQKAGEIGDINFAKSEIKERILIDKRRKLYSSFLYELQKKYHPELLNESINK